MADEDLNLIESSSSSSDKTTDDDDEDTPDAVDVQDEHDAVYQRVRRISEGDEPSPFKGSKKQKQRECRRRNKKKVSRTDDEQKNYLNRIHSLFVKVPPMRTAKFERMVRRNRTLEHEVKVYTELLRDLQEFVKARVGDAITLKIPKLYHGGGKDDQQVGELEDELD